MQYKIVLLAGSGSPAVWTMPASSAWAASNLLLHPLLEALQGQPVGPP